MLCNNCKNTNVEYIDEAKQFICLTCGVVIGVDLDASTDERIGQHTGERVLYQQSKTVSCIFNLHICL